VLHTLRLLPGAVLVMPLLAAVLWLANDAIRLRIGMPLQLNYVEGFNADDATRLAHGGPLYGDPARPPYVVTVYTPGYLSVVASLIALGMPALPAARLVTFLSVLGIAALVAAAGWRRTGWVALAASLFFLLDPILPFWQLVARPDCTAALLALAGVVVLEGTARKGRDVLAAALFAAAVLTKQSSFAAPAAAALFMVLQDRRRALRFAAWLGAFGLGAVAALQVATDGRFLWHTVVGNLDQFSWLRASGLDLQFVLHHVVEVSVLLVLLGRIVLQRRWSVTALWTAAAWAVALASVGKAGSDLNYFIEPMAALALLAAREFPRDWFARPTLASRLAAVGLLVAVACWAVANTLALVGSRRPLADARAEYVGLATLVASERGIVISDDACLLVETGKPVHLQPFVMSRLAEAGRWDQRPVLEELAGGRVRMIIAQLRPAAVFRSRYTPEMRHLITERYLPVRTYRLAGEFTVLVPKPIR
jgi:hypothetical protein